MSIKNQIRQLLLNHLPKPSYDAAQGTLIDKDVIAHAAAFDAVVDDASRVLANISDIPLELLTEYEREFGLPLPCGQNNVGDAPQARLNELKRVMREGHILLNLTGFKALFARYNQQVLAVKTYVPMQCTGNCTEPVNTDWLRFKVTLTLKKPVTASLDCLTYHYLPAALRLDVLTA